MTSGFVRFESVRKAFGNLEVIRSVNLEIGQGEFFSLLGPSGCGKTTLMRIAGGFETATSGRVIIDGQDVTKLPAARRPTNMVFQSYAIFPHLTVAQNIGFGLQHESLSSQEIRRRVGAAVEMVKLVGLESRRPSQLSGGQRQRIALARAIIKRPKVLLLDEPLSALDKNLREQMQEELRGIQRELGTTFLFVTHDQHEALYLSDRIAIMNGGDVIQVATPNEIYRRPQSRFVAKFVGTMNFVQAKVIETSSDASTVEVPGFGLIKCQAILPASVGDTVTVGIRPEAVRVLSKPEPLAAPAVLTDATPLGEKLVCTFEIGGNRLSAAVFGKDAALLQSTLAPGEGVWVSLDHAGLHLFAD